MMGITLPDVVGTLTRIFWIWPVIN